MKKTDEEIRAEALEAERQFREAYGWDDPMKPFSEVVDQILQQGLMNG